jgi:hypothetical protein
MGNANVTICGESYWFVGEGPITAMKKKKLLMLGLVCAVAVVFAAQVKSGDQ